MTADAVQLAFGGLLLAIGVLFMAAAVVAVVRLPDALSRLHGVTKAETAGLGFVLAGAVLLAPSWRLAVVALAAWLAAAGAGAAAAHMIAVRQLRGEASE